jgi:hypothetical protein
MSALPAALSGDLLVYENESQISEPEQEEEGHVDCLEGMSAPSTEPLEQSRISGR